MKKAIFLLSITVAVAACHSTDQQAQQTLRLKARAAMEQKVSEVIEQLRQDCDSNLVSVATYRADSIYAARSKKSSPRRRNAR